LSAPFEMDELQEQSPMNTNKETKKKRGFLKRFRRKKKKSSKNKPENEVLLAEEEDKENEEIQKTTKKGTDSTSQEEEGPERSEVESTDDEDDDRYTNKSSMPKSILLNAPPAAKDSAFGGPPRYDWIDIETAAAVKVQSIARRNMVMDDLEDQGKSTAAIRNRNRRGGMHDDESNYVNTEDTPSIFQMCGVGLMFGDAAEEDEKARKEREKARYEEKKRLQAVQEEKLRAYKPRNKGTVNMNEALEVIE